MSRTWWIVLGVVAVGVGLAVLLGVLGTRNEPSKTEATSSLCTSLKSLGTSIDNLVNMDTSTATKSDYEANVQAVQDDWDQVKSDAQDVQDAPMGDLDSAWDDFTAAVKDVPNDASVSDAVDDVSQSAEDLKSAAASTSAEVDC